MAWQSREHMLKVQSYPDSKLNQNNNEAQTQLELEEQSELDKYMKEFEQDPHRYSMEPYEVEY